MRILVKIIIKGTSRICAGAATYDANVEYMEQADRVQVSTKHLPHADINHAALRTNRHVTLCFITARAMAPRELGLESSSEVYLANQVTADI